MNTTDAPASGDAALDTSASTLITSALMATTSIVFFFEMLLLLSVFSLCLLHHLLLAVGFDCPGRILHYCVAYSKAQNIREIKQKIIAIKNQITNTSAQDEFAKWAKLRRQHDKLMEEHSSLTSAFSTSQILYATTSNWALYSLLWLVEISIVAWYCATPVFYLPEDWFGPLTSWFKFPFAPYGSVGVFYWWSCVHACLARSTKTVSTILSNVRLDKKTKTD